MSFKKSYGGAKKNNNLITNCSTIFGILKAFLLYIRNPRSFSCRVFANLLNCYPKSVQNPQIPKHQNINTTQTLYSLLGCYSHSQAPPEHQPHYYPLFPLRPGLLFKIDLKAMSTSTGTVGATRLKWLIVWLVGFLPPCTLELVLKYLFTACATTLQGLWVLIFYLTSVPLIFLC